MINTASTHPVNLTEEEYRLCVRVVRLYYEHNLTQSEIGERLGYSRVKINRVLRQAREAGVLEVRINAPAQYFYDLEIALLDQYALKDVIVVPEETPGHLLYLALARGAISWLKPHLKPGLRVGLGLGRTVSYLPQVFTCDKPIDCIFTEVVGAASSLPEPFGSINTTSKMAELCGGRAEYFYAPPFVTDSELKQRLMREPWVIAALEKARSAEVVMQSIGPVDETSLLCVRGYISGTDLENLRRMGAVGDALGHYFNAHGRHVPTLIDNQTIGLELEDLFHIPFSVLIAGGPEKVLPIDAALKGHYFNVLITDRRTALALLSEENDHAW
jgi:DNA-binding transcriptional regulator LsrR (DeoR family)